MNTEKTPSENLDLFGELRRRNVFRVAAAYLVGAWLIIQVAETILPAFEFGDETIRNIVVILAIGFAPALIFSWVFELTPQGLKREVEVARSESITRYTGRKIDRLIILLLTVGIAYFAIDKFTRESGTSTDDVAQQRSQGGEMAISPADQGVSVAVLPFTDMSPQRDQGYLADGISSDILSLLAKLPELRVISRTSAFSFKGQQMELGEIAERLDVNHVLEGTIRLHGEQLRITAQLVKADTDTQLWSEIYDRPMGNVFEIQDEITAAVVERLAKELSPPKAKKVDLDVYNDFLKAEHMRRQQSEESLMSAKRIYEDIVSREPGYAPAWLSLGIIYSNLDSFRLMEPKLARISAIESAERALNADPSIAGAYTLIGWTRIKMGDDFATVAPNFARALELEPSDPGHLGNAGMYLTYIGRLDEGIALTERQVSLDPANVVAYNNLGIRYRLARQYDQAEKSFGTALDLNPSAGGIPYELGVTQLLDNRPRAAAQTLQNEPISPFKEVGLALVEAANGDVDSARTRMDKLVAKYGDSLAYYYSMISAMSNDIDTAFSWLNKAISVGDTDLGNALYEPLLDNLRSDPRWDKFLSRTGQFPEELEKIEFDYSTGK